LHLLFSRVRVDQLPQGDRHANNQIEICEHAELRRRETSVSR
jgi:hypothetical protein